MPLILHENTGNAEIGLWKISEEIDALHTLAKLSLADTIIYSGISALHRKKEWLATRALLSELITDPPLIKYHNDGKPFFENSTVNLSISHSAGYVSIILHTTSVPGIDIELINRKVGRVGSRFLSPEEFEACCEKGHPSDFRMLLHWCAKEAIFKIIPLSEIEFSRDIRISINAVLEEAGSFRGTFNSRPDPITMTLYYRIADELLMVWGWVDPLKFKL